MGRLPKIRVSYFNDAQFILRLIQAIERDPSRPKEWKTKVIEKLQSIAEDFLHAPTVGKKVA